MEQKTVRFLRLDPRAVALAYATPGRPQPTCAPCWTRR